MISIFRLERRCWCCGRRARLLYPRVLGSGDACDDPAECNAAADAISDLAARDDSDADVRSIVGPMISEIGVAA